MSEQFKEKNELLTQENWRLREDNKLLKAELERLKKESVNQDKGIIRLSLQLERYGSPVKPRVVIESPLRGDREANKAYARACMLDCLRRGEAPFASHALYDHPEVLNDEIAEERLMGMEAGFAWGSAADLAVVYEDHGISFGMNEGIERAKDLGIPVIARKIL